jgi:Tfp pilus assembly protein PilF
MITDLERSGLMTRIVLLLLTLTFTSMNVTAQIQLTDASWWQAEIGDARVISQLPADETTDIAREFEAWRHAAAIVTGAVPNSPVPVFIYLFSNQADLADFSWSKESAGFFSSPRAIYLAMTVDPDSMRLARHQYAHFLINQTLPVTTPRWYEEGLADYLSRIDITGGSAVLSPYQISDYRAAAHTSSMISMDILMHDDAALASPLLIQAANIKSSLFLYFLLHSGEQSGLRDYRADLQAYLQFLHEGRNWRYAFDRGFSRNMRQLSAGYDAWLQLEYSQPITLPLPEYVTAGGLAAFPVPREQLTLALGELALHGGEFAAAESFFAELVAAGSPSGRAYAGLADARRMQEIDTDLHSLYKQAISVEPDNAILWLDYGQFIESLLTSCDLSLPEQEQGQLQESMEANFWSAVQRFPDLPEANLSIAQIYLLPGADWQKGVSYHQKAWSALPADSFIAEQAARYAIAGGDFIAAKVIIDRLARPMHLWGEHHWVRELNERLEAARRNRSYNSCGV